MASQNTFGIPPPSPGSHGNVVIRMKRKRQAPPLESFVIESASSDGMFAKPKPKSGKTIFTRSSSIDLTSPINSEIARILGNESVKQSNDIGGKMKKLKLGELEMGAEDLSPTILVPKPDLNSTNSTAETIADKVKVFDIFKDSKTEALSIKSISAPLAPSTVFTHVVTCNGEEMTREIAPNAPQNLEEHNYVYDLYYTEDADLSMFDDPTAILINPLDYDITWVDPFTNQHAQYNEDYDDESLSDDSNKETNWRNEYGDSGSENEIDRMHCRRYGTEQGDYYLPDFNDPEGLRNLWTQDLGINYDENDDYKNGSDLSDDGY